MNLTQLQQITEQIQEKFGDLPVEVDTGWERGPVDPGGLFFLVETTKRTSKSQPILLIRPRPEPKFIEEVTRKIVWSDAGFKPDKNDKVLKVSPFS